MNTMNDQPQHASPSVTHDATVAHNTANGPATLADIARATGFSLMTVSNALRGKPKVSAANRERIRQVAREMGYQANVAATTLRSRRSGIIQVVVDDFEVPFHARIAKYLTLAAAERGYQVVVRQSQSAREEVKALNPGPGLIYDGIILDAPNITERQVIEHGTGRPAIVIGDCGSFVNVDSMDTACAQGAAAAAEHLIQAGCRRLFVLGAAHPDDQEAGHGGGNGFGPSRLAGVMDALAAHGLTLTRDQCINCPWSSDGGEQTADMLCDRFATASATSVAAATVRVPDDGTTYAASDDAYAHGWGADVGMLCMTDMIAIGALRRFGERGVRVPQDAKLIGFDGIPFSAYTSPSISTVEMDVPAMAATVVDRMIALIDRNRNSSNHDGSTDNDGNDADINGTGTDGIMHAHIPFRLIPRESTAD
ncbi:LacI family transcriptional regulator [Bifidobacterium ramosum]|uniref:LacI family DNA-binding transcriptional regulator n=2 Tax=Bifidobacterium ramosum TaxID=1798158 RepID=A0A6L4X0X7_9BIFI|nr:LacI family DNA-binding transcriptional regulator [Bifidobacterium ramosum]KAB8288089.1 LacI family transcriptional regulator [Bifidobacterium ramosum]NEG72691.1 LacI family DNA-binding transcriptional regulator [Bifidobacterium ramosum]